MIRWLPLFAENNHLLLSAKLEDKVMPSSSPACWEILSELLLMLFDEYDLKQNICEGLFALLH